MSTFNNLLKLQDAGNGICFIQNSLLSPSPTPPPVCPPSSTLTNASDVSGHLLFQHWELSGPKDQILESPLAVPVTTMLGGGGRHQRGPAQGAYDILLCEARLLWGPLPPHKRVIC